MICDGCEVKSDRIRELEEDGVRIADLSTMLEFARTHPGRIPTIIDTLRELATEMGNRAIVLRVS